MGVVCMVVVRISMKPIEMWNVGIRILVTGAADASVSVGGCRVMNCWTELELAEWESGNVGRLELSLTNSAWPSCEGADVDSVVRC